MQFCYRLTLSVLIYTTLCPIALATVPASWKQGAYAYVAKSDSLEKVLNDFSRGVGVSFNQDKTYSAVVDGTIRAASPESFLNRLSIKYQFQWFVYNDTLYISDIKDRTSKQINTGIIGSTEAKQALIDIGLFESRFGWGEINNTARVLVSGPKKYVSLIEKFLTLPKETPPKRVTNMIFPIKHMSVSDRTIVYRDQKTTVPGMASLIQRLMGGDGGDLGNELQQPGMKDMVASSDKTLQTLVERNLPQGLAPYSERSNGRFVADVINNAVIIRDDPSLRLEYQSLIAKLDIPKKVVGVRALLVDIDRNKLNQLSVNWLTKVGKSTVSSFIGRRGTIRINNLPNLLTDINALEEAGYAKISSSPSLVTLDNYPALIDFNDIVYVRLLGEKVASMQAISVGTSLRVTPRTIVENSVNKIYLFVDIEDGKLKPEVHADNINLAKGSISTQVIIDEGSALVIGSMRNTSLEHKESKVPILGNIPVIGKLFTSVNTIELNRDRIFIILPEVVEDYSAEGADKKTASSVKYRNSQSEFNATYDIPTLVSRLNDGVASK